MKRKSIAVMLLGSLVLFVLLFGTQTFAQVIELKYATLYPATHAYSLADQNWIAKIEKETDGKVKIKPYWSATLISSREAYRELTSGVTDIGFINTLNEKAGFDLTKFLIGTTSGLPADKTKYAIKLFWEIYDKFPELQKEFESVKLLATSPASPMPLMTTKKPVKTLADLKGLRIKTSANFVGTLREFGAEGVPAPMSEAFESLQKNIMTGVFSSYETYKSFRFAEVVKYETSNLLSYRGPYGSRAMNKNVWNKLPPDIQKVFEANKEYWSLEVLRLSDRDDITGKEFGIKAGVQFVKMDPADVQKFEAVYDAQQRKEAQELDKKGLPGTKMYDEARRLVKQYSTMK